jgi:hypothetical protein
MACVFLDADGPAIVCRPLPADYKYYNDFAV